MFGLSAIRAMNSGLPSAQRYTLTKASAPAPDNPRVLTADSRTCRTCPSYETWSECRQCADYSNWGR